MKVEPISDTAKTLISSPFSVLFPSSSLVPQRLFLCFPMYLIFKREDNDDMNTMIFSRLQFYLVGVHPDKD